MIRARDEGIGKTETPRGLPTTWLIPDPPYPYPILLPPRSSASTSAQQGLPQKLLVGFLSRIQSVSAPT